MKQKKEYKSWWQMNRRCYDTESPSYHNYGGRGIIVCERWRNSFKNFLEDMGDKPDVTYTLDRIDVNGNYEPSNCKWSSKEEQANNKRNCIYLTLNGEKLTVSQWARKVGINKMTILRRLNLGWSHYDAVFKDIKKDVELNKVELVPKLRELGLKVEDIAFFCKVKPNAIYNILKKHKYDNNNRKTKVSNKR